MGCSPLNQCPDARGQEALCVRRQRPSSFDLVNEARITIRLGLLCQHERDALRLRMHDRRACWLDLATEKLLEKLGRLDLSESAEFQPGDRVKTLRGSTRGVVRRVLPDEHRVQSAELQRMLHRKYLLPRERRERVRLRWFPVRVLRTERDLPQRLLSAKAVWTFELRVENELAQFILTGLDGYTHDSLLASKRGAILFHLSILEDS